MIDVKLAFHSDGTQGVHGLFLAMVWAHNHDAKGKCFDLVGGTVLIAAIIREITSSAQNGLVEMDPIMEGGSSSLQCG